MVFTPLLQQVCLLNVMLLITMKMKIIKNESHRLSRLSKKQTIHYPAGIYLLKVNNRNTRTRCEICSKLTIKTPERRH